jgi:hypothetical protein
MNMANDFRGTEVFGRRPRASGPDTDETREPGRTLGVVALLAALLTIILVVVGVTSAMHGDYAGGSALAYVATGSSIVAVLGGLAAILFHRGRGWGIIAVVLGLAADPLLLTQVLKWASGLG